jgi:predicted MFS family arabinose efflux permease
MWVPTLLSLSGGYMPTGLIFSCFMVAMTIGGALSSLVISYYPQLSSEALCLSVYAASAAAMTVPVYAFDFWPVFIAFLCLETMQGVFNSSGAQLRSKYYPENLRSSIMTVFRLPLNLLVVMGTKLSEKATDASSFRRVFFLVAMMHAVALVMQYFIWQYRDVALETPKRDYKFKSE